MAKIAFLLLCHKDPAGIAAQARRLSAAGDFVAIHFDARASAADYRVLREAVGGDRAIAFAKKRVKCGWGEWSLVEATLSALSTALESFPAATHFYMLSGDCMTIKSAEYAHEYLDRASADYIESFDFYDSGWIKTGPHEERLAYRHYFNERKRKRLFYASLELQKKVGLKRNVPAGIRMMIGSQWWCLRRRTVEAVLDFCRKRRDVVRFFRTTWIPDETFFQTLVAHLVPESEIRKRTLTFLMFTDYGMPVTFYNDHYDLLIAQDFLFARKISPGAAELKRRLGELYASTGASFTISNEGPQLYRFLAERGRNGRRFAPRFWERENAIGHERQLLIVTCKKWHVGKRLIDEVKKRTNMPALEYLFDEAAASLPDLGGIETSLEKRNRHRRALMRMLFDAHETNRLLFCLDPKDIEHLRDFYADRCETRLLEIECRFSDEYLVGHAARVGLASGNTAPETLTRLLPTIRYDIEFETSRIREAGFPRAWRIREGLPPEDNAAPLAAFLGISEAEAREIAATPHLFSD
jgi:hypothetical protein